MTEYKPSKELQDFYVKSSLETLAKWEKSKHFRDMRRRELEIVLGRKLPPSPKNN